MKQQSALQQTVNNLLAQTNFAANTTIPNLLNQAQQMFQTATNRVANIQPPTQKAQKGAQPIATMKNGSVLYSDGTTKPGQAPNQLQVLRQNVLDQRSFSPQAQKYLESLPLYYGQAGSNDLGQFTSNQQSPQYGIAISPDVFNSNVPTKATEVLTHEFMHALDANVNGTPGQSYPDEGAYSAYSKGFFPAVEANSNPTTARQVASFLAAYAQPDQYGEPILHPRVADQEAFAQYAAPQGERVLLGPLKNSYGNIFEPASKVTNYTPVNPISNGATDLFNQFRGQDNFGG